MSRNSKNSGNLPDQVKILGIPVRLEVYEADHMDGDKLGYSGFKEHLTIGINRSVLDGYDLSHILWSEILHMGRMMLCDGHLEEVNMDPEEHLTGQMSCIIDSVLRENEFMRDLYYD